MRTVPITLANVVLSLYAADASGNPDVGRPVFLGARTERLRLTGRIEEFEFTGSGEVQRDYGQAGEEHEIAVDQIQCLGLDTNGTWQDFPLQRGRYVMAIYGQDPKTRVYYRRTYYGVQTKERGENSDQAQQYFVQSKVFRARTYLPDSGRLAEGEDTRAGLPAVGTPTSIENSYLFFYGGPAPVGDLFIGQYQFTTAMRLTYAKAIAASGSSGSATVLQLEGNGTPLLTLVLPEGSGEVSAVTDPGLAIDIPANTLLRWRVLSGPADVESLASMISVTMNLASLDGPSVVYTGTPPPSGGTGGGTTVVGGAITERKDFVVPASSWTWVHNLGYRPLVSVYVDDVKMDAAVSYPDANTILVSFASLVAGYVIIVH